MAATDSGMVISCKSHTSLNALEPMVVTELGITVTEKPSNRVLVAVSMMALQLSRESYT